MTPALFVALLLTFALAAVIFGPVIAEGLARLRDYTRRQSEDVDSIWKEKRDD